MGTSITRVARSVKVLTVGGSTIRHRLPNYARSTGISDQIGVIPMVTEVRPGDVVVVRDTRSIFGLIILAAALLRRTPLYSHVIVASHRDAAGTLWGIEGRPSGVGQVDLSPWLAKPETLTTSRIPMAPAQGASIAAGVDAMRGTRYDWDAIAIDAMDTIGAQELWNMSEYDGVKGVPAQVVCSSLAAYWWLRVGLPTPKPIKGKWRRVRPTEWAQFILHYT